MRPRRLNHIGFKFSRKRTQNSHKPTYFKYFVSKSNIRSKHSSEYGHLITLNGTSCTTLGFVYLSRSVRVANPNFNIRFYSLTISLSYQPAAKGGIYKQLQTISSEYCAQSAQSSTRPGIEPGKPLYVPGSIPS